MAPQQVDGNTTVTVALCCQNLTQGNATRKTGAGTYSYWLDVGAGGVYMVAATIPWESDSFAAINPATMVALQFSASWGYVREVARCTITDPGGTFVIAALTDMHAGDRIVFRLTVANDGEVSESGTASLHFISASTPWEDCDAGDPPI